MKRNNLDVERSIVQIQDWIVDGISHSQIVESCISNEWCKSATHADRLIRRAKDRWLKEQDATLLEKRIIKEKELIALKDRLSRKYKGTPAGILAIARVEALIIKLTGMASPVKVQVTGANDGPIQIKESDGIDYDKLSPEVLRALADARKTTN